MKISYPTRTEAQVWHQQFQIHLMQWLESEGADGTALNGALDALRNQTEREPATAGFTAQLISALARQHKDTVPATQLERLASRGLSAIRLVSEPSAIRSLTQSSLLNHLACAYIALGREGEAVEQLKQSISALDEAAVDEAVGARLLVSQAHVLAGQANEALLDYEAALEHFDAAIDSTTALVEDDGQMAAALRTVIELDFPETQLPEEAIRLQLQMLWHLLSELRIDASAGAGRSAVQADPGSVDERLKRMAEVAETNGLASVTPMALAVQVAAADHEVAVEATARILRSVEQLESEVDEFGAVLNAALSTSAPSSYQRDDCIELTEDFLNTVVDPIIRAAAYGFLLASNAPDAATYLEPFLAELDNLDRLEDERMADPANRIVFDEPVLAALMAICEAGEGELPWDVEARQRLARLVDYDFARHTPLDGWLPSGFVNEGLERIRELLRDRFARANTALRDWSDTLVLVLRTLHDRTLFIALNGEDAPRAVVADGEYSKYATALAKHVDREISLIGLTGAASEVDALEKCAGRVYDALPVEIREAIERVERLLVCPDHRASGGSVPFELFHSGEGWLGIEKEVARFPNLRTLVRCLEGTARRDHHRRLLALAIPEAEGFDPLKFASLEVASVRDGLVAHGWDAPTIEPTRITSEFVLERFPYVTHLHVAAHGEARGQSEAVVLNGSEKLSGAMLLGRYVPSMPTAYINACELGTSRWAGSGRAQSIPYALVGSGCPAVVANLLPVEDQASSNLAKAFYGYARKSDFGRSLMAARLSMAERDVHPVFWGTTVLIGDPTVSLNEPNTLIRNLSQLYLEGLHPTRSAELSDDILIDLRMQLLAEPDDVRLAAAVEFARVVQSWQPDPPNYDWLDVCALCHAAYEFDHAGWLAFLVFMAHQTMDDELDLEEKTRFYDNAIMLTEPLEGEADLWVQILNELLVAWLHAVRGDRMPQLQMHGPGSEDQEDFMKAVQAMTDIQLAIEAKEIRAGKGPVSRPEETIAEDVLWNAVVAGRDYRLEGMRELYEYAATIVDKLVGLGALLDRTRHEAATAFAGMLHWLWGSQNQAMLASEFIEGQTGVLELLVESLNVTWKRRAWFEPPQQFVKEMAANLESLEGLPYDDKLYPRIDEVMEEIKTSAEEALRVTEEKYPDHLCATTAWILGALIECNTYSYVDGSVPEHIEERLRKVMYSIDTHAEGRFYPWLMKGFQRVREAEYDELARWKYLSSKDEEADATGDETP